MTEKLTRLELTWPGKEDRFNPEPRILLEDKEKSFSYEKDTNGMAKDIFDHFDVKAKVEPTYDNMLIHGDNLLALKALEQDYTGKVKCIYIDPPYNTGSAFKHYDDGLEHSIWLSLMRERLEILHRLLAEDGSIWISIDDNEQAYLKILCDEIFHRSNFLNDVIWNSTKSVTNTAIISVAHTHTLVYFKNMDWWVKHRTDFRMPEDGIGFENPDHDPRGPWKADPFQVGGWRPNQQYEITNPNTGVVYKPNKGCSWKNDYEKFQELIKDNRIVFGKNGTAGPQRKRFLYEAQDRGKVTTTIWDDVNTTTNATQHSKKLFGDDSFSNPKPEELIERILYLSTKPGDLVLDSFLGSGTTAAVAHKMGRRWIGIEMGDHVYTHCLPRLQKVIKGEDAGGVTKSTGWLCGGGFKFYELASSLIVKDKYGQQIISDKYNADMLAEAMCKILGYHYKPDAEKYWKQGFSSEKSFIFTTTMSVQEESLDKLAAEVGDNNLLICCSAFVGNKSAFPNITVKKIPSAILKKCEWGRDGYPLNLSKYTPKDEDFEFEEEEE